MKKQLRLLTYILATLMTLSGCKMKVEEQKVPEFSKPTTSTESQIEDAIDETIEQEQLPSKPVEIIPETKPQEIPTEPEVIPTVPEITEPVVEGLTVVKPTTTVNVRVNSSVNSLKIGSLDINETAIRILSLENGWDLVKINDRLGYINNSYLQETDETIEQENNYVLKNDIVLTTTTLNFRTEPTTSSKIIEELPENTELQVIAQVNDEWLLVRYNGNLGYVYSSYTNSLLEKLNETYPDLNIQELSPQKIVYSNTTLNIRNGNSTDYDQIGQLEKFESIRVLGEYEDWYLIMTNDYNFGFVSKEYTKDLTEDFIIVDKSEQQLYFYNGNDLYFTTPVTTGKDSTPSDTGLFKIYAKQTNRYLTDGKTYNSWVGYWMPYNGGEGLHDANWRTVFGTESYHTGGSHGCINLPPELADDIYNNASVGTKVLVHK